MPSNDEIMQTRLAASRHISQSPPGSIAPDGFAWSQSYRQDVTALLARLEAVEQARDDWEKHAEECETRAHNFADDCRAAKARAEAAEQALREIASETWNRKTFRSARQVARAALAGREETGGGGA